MRNFLVLLAVLFSILLGAAIVYAETYLPIVVSNLDIPTPTQTPTPNLLATTVEQLIQTLTAQPTAANTATPNPIGTLVAELQLTSTKTSTPTDTETSTPTPTNTATETPTGTPNIQATLDAILTQIAPTPGGTIP